MSDGFEWRLRDLMTEAGIHQNAELLRRLRDNGIQLSSSQVHRLVTEVPDRLNLKVLAALCRILEVSPADLIEVHETHSKVAPKAVVAGSNVVDLAGEIRPKRARVIRD